MFKTDSAHFHLPDAHRQPTHEDRHTETGRGSDVFESVKTLTSLGCHGFNPQVTHCEMLTPSLRVQEGFMLRF